MKITSEEARTLLEEAIAKVSESLKTDFKREQIITAENLKVQLQQMLEPRLEKLERETSVLKHMQRRTGKKLTRYMKAPSGDGYCNHLKGIISVCLLCITLTVCKISVVKSTVHQEFIVLDFSYHFAFKLHN